MTDLKINYGENDELFREAIKYVQENQKVSTFLFRKKFNIGFARSARLIDELETAGVIGPGNGGMPREIFIDNNGNLKPQGEKSKKSFKIINKKNSEKHTDFIRRIANLLEQTLDRFGIVARVAEINDRPTDIEFALEIALGTKIADILALEKDIALALACPPKKLQIEAPIPGRSLIAIRIPYPDYKKISDPKPVSSPEGKKEVVGLPEVKKRDDLDEIWRIMRACASFVFYLIARLFSAVADFVYPERKNS